MLSLTQNSKFKESGMITPDEVRTTVSVFAYMSV